MQRLGTTNCRITYVGNISLFVSLLILTFFLSSVNAQDKVLAIKGGDIYTITSGVIPNGTLLVKEGRIWKLGTGLAIPKDAKVIDAKGKVVLPGMVAIRGRMGTSGYGKITDILDPYQHSVQLSLASGITAVYITGGGNDAVIKPTYADLDNMLVKESIYKDISFSSQQWLQKTELLMALRKGQTYLQDLALYNRIKDKDKKAEAPKKPSGIDPYLPLLQKKTVALIEASKANDILGALKLVDEFGIRMILSDTTEAWTVAQEIAKRQVSVIITPRRQRLPDEKSNYESGTSLENAHLLKQAGVKFAILPPRASLTSSGSGMAGRDLLTLPLEAAFAISGGLDEQTALEAITITPAELLGVSDRIGSLQVGKDADIIIFDGHPLHYNSFVETTIVNGKVLYEKDKSTFFSHIKHDK